jgi:hypothetical protein
MRGYSEPVETREPFESYPEETRRQLAFYDDRRLRDGKERAGRQWEPYQELWDLYEYYFVEPLYQQPERDQARRERRDNPAADDGVSGNRCNSQLIRRDGRTAQQDFAPNGSFHYDSPQEDYRETGRRPEGRSKSYRRDRDAELDELDESAHRRGR